MRGSLGAGDVVVAPGLAIASMGLVLEPEVDARKARQMGPLAMVAIADGLGALLPPKVAIEHRWPGTILLNGGSAAAVRLAMPDGGEDAVPDWMVLGMEIRLAFPASDIEPGAMASSTCLAEEGGAELLAGDILSCVSAHILTWLDIWQSDGFGSVARAWLFRAEGQGAPVVLGRGDTRRPGRVLGLDDDVRLSVEFEREGRCLLEWPAVLPGLADVAGAGVERIGAVGPS